MKQPERVVELIKPEVCTNCVVIRLADSALTVDMYETICNEEELQVLLETRNDDNTSSEVNGHEEESNEISVRDVLCIICVENVSNTKKCSSGNQGMNSVVNMRTDSKKSIPFVFANGKMTLAVSVKMPRKVSKSKQKKF